MYRSWKDHLIRHKGNKDLNKNASLLQQKFPPSTTPDKVFTELIKHKSIVCTSRAPLSEEVQLTFHHDAVTASITQTTPFHYGLMGFGARAKAVRLNINQHFFQTLSTHKVPSFKDLLNCTSREEILAVNTSDEKKKLQFFAALPPCLSHELLDEDNLEAANILCKFVSKIKSMRTKEDDEASESELIDEDDLGNVEVEDDDLGNVEVEEIQPTEQNADDLQKESEAFYPILIFLLSIIKK